jgi:ribosomal protein L37AE/L43A
MGVARIFMKFSCDECGRKFEQMELVLCTNGKKKAFLCESCKKSFASEGYQLSII